MLKYLSRDLIIWLLHSSLDKEMFGRAKPFILVAKPKHTQIPRKLVTRPAYIIQQQYG
jgi:hypothetical protein